MLRKLERFAIGVTAPHLRFASTRGDKLLPLLSYFYDREAWRPQYTPVEYPNTDLPVFAEPQLPLFDADTHAYEFVEVPEWEDAIGTRHGWGLRPERDEEGFRRSLWEQHRITS